MKNAIALALILFASACATLAPATESAIRDGIAVDAGHMADENLPQPAREIAQDNYDLLWQILYATGHEDELPFDVRQRMDARAAQEGAE